ncbi:MAG: NOB1 family endonuclease [Promethearchaeota archaeon]|jgi:rRNA maturation endonuclease Nob1
MKSISPIFIFDTNIFLTGIDFNLFNGIIYTTPSIIEEVKVSKYKDKNRNIMNKITAAIESKKLELLSPKKKSITEIKEVAKKTGDFKALSDADNELIALAWELIENNNENVTIFTNDYSIENVCSELNIPYSPLFKEGIKNKIIWQVYCINCGTIHKNSELNEFCENCGSKLKRRPRTTRLN